MAHIDPAVFEAFATGAYGNTTLGSHGALIDERACEHIVTNQATSLQGVHGRGNGGGRGSSF